MARTFDRNMFIMLLSIMIGAVIITFFIADLQFSSDRETLISQHSAEIDVMEQKNINFTTRFITSLGQLDRAREDRANGNYHFELALMWYTTALSETNETKMNSYRDIAIDNCSEAKIEYIVSQGNFGVSNQKFVQTKTYAHEMYFDLLDLYINLTASGSKLTSLRAEAVTYLQYLNENLTMSENGTVEFLENVTALQANFTIVMGYVGAEERVYGGIEEQIESEYNIEGFSEFREE